MLFSNRPRTHFNNAPIHEVICQLRFPTNLSINNAVPADFQEAIREEFPQYLKKQEAVPPRRSGCLTENPRSSSSPL